MPRVFISHSTKDRDFVEDILVPALCGHGLETWHSSNDIQTADDWERSILNGLKSCDWFLIVMSPNSAKSKWVRHELRWAMDNRTDGRIVPVMIEACDPYDFHIGLAGLQFGDYSQDREKALALLRAIWAPSNAPITPRKTEPVSDVAERAKPEPPPAKARIEPVPPPSREPEPLPDLITTKTADIPLKLIPVGIFLMGSPEGKGDGLNDERPQHKVTISRPFYLGIHPVTQAQYAKVMGKNPSYFAATGGGKGKVAGMDTSRFPVECVSWYDSLQFCNALSKAERLDPYYKIQGNTVEIAGGGGFCLPTEAEWEYAYRAGTSSAYGFEGGVMELDRYAWFCVNSGGRTHAVGEARANKFGLYDMHGNVWEWTWDMFKLDYYLGSPEVDPRGPSDGSGRVIRGGSWLDSIWYCRAAYRRGYTPTDAFNGLGLRLARVPSGPAS